MRETHRMLSLIHSCRVRNWLLIITGLLTAVTTAFCGPVAFIGLAVPHVARMILGTANHNSLLPVTILSGGAVALLCNLICVLPGEAGIIPLNAVTPIIGAPVIIYVIPVSYTHLDVYKRQVYYSACFACLLWVPLWYLVVTTTMILWMMTGRR